VARWLALDGVEAERCIADALDRIGGVLSYLRAAAGPVAGAARPGTPAGDGQLSRASCKDRAISCRSSRPAGRVGIGNAATAALTTDCRKASVAATAASPHPTSAGLLTWPALPTIRQPSGHQKPWVISVPVSSKVLRPLSTQLQPPPAPLASHSPATSSASCGAPSSSCTTVNFVTPLGISSIS
jgi:hypothetical protein